MLGPASAKSRLRGHPPPLARRRTPAAAVESACA